MKGLRESRDIDDSGIASALLSQIENWVWTSFCFREGEAGQLQVLFFVPNPSTSAKLLRA